MTFKISCSTLFDITQTGVLNRRTPQNLSEELIRSWEYKRNQQCNFDTIIQLISLRIQPEEITTPTMEPFIFEDIDMFGFLFDGEEAQMCWTFEFTVNNIIVFNDGINDLGALYTDCDSVPMIKNLGEWEKLPNFLDISPELRNIYFEII